MTFNSLYKGGFDASKIFSEAIVGNPSIAKELIRLIAGVKHSTNVPVMGGGIPAQAYTCEPTPSATLSYTERNVTLSKVTFYDEMCLDNLRATYANQYMKAGASNLEAPEFNMWLETYASEQIAKGLDSLLWNGATVATKASVAASGLSAGLKAIVAGFPTTVVDSFIADAILSGVAGVDPIYVDGDTLSSSNIVVEIGKMFSAISDEVFNSNQDGKLKIFLPYNTKKFIAVANNQATNYTKPFDLVNGSYSYNGVAIEFVGLPSNTGLVGVAGTDGNLVVATDLASDWSSVEINKVNNSGDNIFIKAVVGLATAAIVQGQIVVYGA
jgi:hypothetical protein